MPGTVLTVEGIAWAELLAGLHAAAYDAAERWETQAMAALLCMPGCFACLGADAFGAVQGMALARVVADEAEILSLVVQPPSRSRGVGRSLLRHALTEAATRGATRAYLEVSEGNAAAITLYRRVGFAEIGRRTRYYSDGSNALVMSCELRPLAPAPLPCE